MLMARVWGNGSAWRNRSAVAAAAAGAAGRGAAACDERCVARRPVWERAPSRGGWVV